MLKKITWQEGRILSLKLKDDLYTLVQMRENYYLQFFDLTNTQNTWTGVNLEKVDLL